MILIISIIIALIITIYLSLRTYALILLSILIINLIYKYFKEYKNTKKYNRFLLKKRKNITDMDLAFSFIESIPQYKKIIIDKNNIILIISRGIYFIKLTNYESYITGNINDDFLLQKYNFGANKIYNVLKDYDKELKKYQNKINEPIEKYAVVKNGCIFDVSCDIKVIQIKKMHFEFNKTGLKTLYDENKINEIYNKLNKM